MAKQDIYEAVTNSIIEAIESGQTGDKFKLPWDGEMVLPENIQSQNYYRGVNVAMLWAWGMKKGYSSAKWGTYKQWAEKGAQVKKGEKAIKIVFWKTVEIEPSADNEEGQNRMYARWSSVFNADQVEGYEENSDRCEIKRVVQADTFISFIGADIRHGGHRAFYNRKEDYIQIPCPEDFKATKTSSTSDNYYSTLLHEATHWSGAPHRLDRTKGKTFGDDDYIFEELVAELGSAMLCCLTGIMSEPRADHAQYIDSWLDEMKGDKSFIFKAASQAQKAADYLMGFQEKTELAA